MSSASAFALVGRELRLVAVNDAYCVLVQRREAALVGRGLFEVFPDRPDSFGGQRLVRASIETVFVTGETETMPLLRYDVEDLDDPGEFVVRFWSVTISPVPETDGEIEHVVIHAEEVTEFIAERFQKEASGDRPLSASATGAVDSVFAIELSRLEALNSLAEALVSADTTEQVARAFLRDGLALVGAVSGLFVSVRDDHIHVADDARNPIEDWPRCLAEPGRDPICDVVDSGEPLFFSTRDELTDRYQRADLDAVNFDADDRGQAWAVLPLIVRDGAVGAIVVAFDRTYPFSEPIRLGLSTLRDLIRQAAARALLRSEQAATLESVAVMLDPRLDPIPGCSYSALYRPATQLADAGGDWYDAILVDEDHVLILIGDVADHGPRVVGEMARARATVHACAISKTDPAQIAQHASTVLDAFANSHTTACIAIYQPSTRHLAWCTAGHPFPLVRKATGDVIALAHTHGAPLGFITANPYNHSETTLDPGDTIILYTDGLIERPSEPFDHSLQRLIDTATGAVDTDNFAEHIYDNLIGESTHADDIAILTLTIGDNT